MGPRLDDAQLVPPPDVGDGPGWVQLPRQGCRMLGQPCWHGRTEWLLDFGLTDPAAAPGRVAALRLVQVTPSLLQSIEVRDCGQLRFGLDICEGRRGFLASAGELLLAMAAAQGQHGLYIDGLDLGADLLVQRLSLRLRVWDESAPAGQVQVRVADDAWPLQSPTALTALTALTERATGLPAQSRPAA